MRSALACLLLIACTCFTGLLRADPAVRTARFHGRDYVRLMDWSKTQSLAVSWITPDKSIQLRNPAWRISLIVDSREARINGVQFWLLYPLVYSQGGLYMSAVDVQSTLTPLLRPSAMAKGARIRTICIDAGHGGKDPGHRTGSRWEKVYTLLLANELAAQLRKAGYQVIFTRTKDATVELEDRPAIAIRNRADLFISLHFNAAGSPRSPAQGTEVYSLTPARAPSTNSQGEGADEGNFPGNRNNQRNLLLAYHVQKSLISTLGTTDRGVRRARFAVLRTATMPSVLIEAGFLSHPTEGRKILTSAYRQRIAKAIVQGVGSYQKVVVR